MQKGSYAISALHGQLATECHLGSTGTSGLHRRNTDLGAKDVEQSEAKSCPCPRRDPDLWRLGTFFASGFIRRRGPTPAALHVHVRG